jgi:hypothetical protein
VTPNYLVGLLYLNGVVHQTIDALKETLERVFLTVKPEKIMEICSLRIIEKHRII